MGEYPPFWGSAASWVLLIWIHLTMCLLLVRIALDPVGSWELVGVTGALMLFSSPLGLAGWRIYGWRLAQVMAGVGIALFVVVVLASR